MTQPCIIDSASGHLVAGSSQPFILALKLGENLFDGILRAAQDAGLKSASISGLGAVAEITIAYYNLDTKSYQKKLFAGMYELVSLNGNIAMLDGKLFLHIHAAIGDPQYQLFGGHIMDATTGASAEITIVPLSGEIHRQYDDQSGLKIMCPITP